MVVITTKFYTVSYNVKTLDWPQPKDTSITPMTCCDTPTKMSIVQVLWKLHVRKKYFNDDNTFVILT